jgi:hypothetical protein
MTDEESLLWAGIFERAMGEVAVLNGNNPKLTFTRRTNGFQITRQAPYLTVQRWMSEGSIYGSFESRDAKGLPVHGLVQPVLVRDDSHRGILLESNGASVTVEDIVSLCLLGFREKLNE